MYSEQGPATVGAKAGDRDQRRHVRVEHTGTVEFVGEGRRFSGQAVNISRTGMQVVVNLPDSYASVRSITFRLPNAPGAVDLPCRLVRRHEAPSPDGAAGHVLGVEFSYESEAQMLLIENYVRELREGELFASGTGNDPRQIPRARCDVRDVLLDREDARVLSIDNISTEGLLISFVGALRPGDDIRLRFRLPCDERRVTVHARVLYAIASAFSGVSSAGVRLLQASAVDANRIRDFVVQAASRQAVKSLHGRVAARGLDSQYCLKDRSLVLATLRTVAAKGLYFNALFDGDLTVRPLPAGALSPDENGFSAAGAVDLPPTAAPGSRVYFSFYLDGCSHYFASVLTAATPDTVWFETPAVVFRSEQRSYGRKSAPATPDVSLLLYSETDQELPTRGRVLDISRHGFLVEVPAPPCPVRDLGPGCHLTYSIDEGLRLDCHGTIRHVRQRRDAGGRPVLHIGVEAGVRRGAARWRRCSEQQWRSDTGEAQEQGLSQPLGCSEVVRYRNRRGQEIIGLLNATKPSGSAPVVVIPPAFGKKKESLAALALCLVSNFQRAGRDVVVLRYDGVNRPGESYNEDPNPRRGLEMLHYRLSQGLDDLRASLEFVRGNSRYPPEKVILVSFSLSSIDARKLLAGDEKVADYWVSCMGIPAAKASIGAILGGIDIIGNFKMGIPNGTGGMLGYLVNMDAIAEDLIANKYAHITDARSDMARVSVPVLWIYGTHDRWVDPEDVQDIMTVNSGGPREVVEIPTGHNLRTSDDALRTFRLITGNVFRQLHGEELDVRDPGREETLRTITQERERLKNAEGFDPQAYWRGYLLGGEKNRCGYDFLRNIADFREFISLEADLMNPQAGDRIADMGCGTGLLLEAMLTRLAGVSGEAGQASFIAADLVAEGLSKAQAKCEKLAQRYPVLRAHHVEFRRVDLEPNRLLPIKLFVENQELGFDFLRDRVPGVRSATLELLERIGGEPLREIARGAPMSEANLSYLADTLRDGHRSTVLDLNRAARLLAGRLQASDLIPSRRPRLEGPLAPAEYAGLSAADLVFERLQLGGCTPDFTPAFSAASFTKIAASLFVSYVANADLVLREFNRLLEPGGRLLVSSMKPDSDISVIFTEYIQKVQNFDLQDTDILNRDLNLDAARAMLNDAASLFSLEEDGFFRFYSGAELVAMLEKAGFTGIRVWDALGCPAQATVVVGHKPAMRQTAAS